MDQPSEGICDFHFTPQSFRDWLNHRRETKSLKSIASRAIDAFEMAWDNSHGIEHLLDAMYSAATHPRFVVWEVGLPLLSRLAQRSVDARERISSLAVARQAEIRRRSIQYLNDLYPRAFCVDLLRLLLADRSAVVRGFAAGRTERLNLHEMLPTLQAVRDKEKNKTAVFELELAIHLLRDNFFEYENSNGYNLVLRFPELWPPMVIWPAQIDRERVMRDGIDAIRREVRDQSVGGAVGGLRRPWAWDTARSEGDAGDSTAFGRHTFPGTSSVSRSPQITSGPQLGPAAVLGLR